MVSDGSGSRHVCAIRAGTKHGRTSISFSSTSAGSLLSSILLPTSELDPEAALASLRHAGGGFVTWFPNICCFWERYVLMLWRG